MKEPEQVWHELKEISGVGDVEPRESTYFEEQRVSACVAC